MQTDRLWIDYGLTFATPFHFGTGIREGLIDRTVIHDDGGYLYVPGSTLKGVLRERCEQLARFYEGASVRSPHDADAALLGLGNSNPSMVARIFGSQNRPGRLFFDDARQDNLQLAEYDSQNQKNAAARANIRLYRLTYLHRCAWIGPRARQCQERCIPANTARTTWSSRALSRAGWNAQPSIPISMTCNTLRSCLPTRCCCCWPG